MTATAMAICGALTTIAEKLIMIYNRPDKKPSPKHVITVCVFVCNFLHR